MDSAPFSAAPLPEQLKMVRGGKNTQVEAAAGFSKRRERRRFGFLSPGSTVGLGAGLVWGLGWFGAFPSFSICLREESAFCYE